MPRLLTLLIIAITLVRSVGYAATADPPEQVLKEKLSAAWLQPIRVHFQDLPLEEVIRILQLKTGLGIVLNNDIQMLREHERVTFKTTSMPAIEVLARCLKAHSLYSKKFNGIVVFSFKPLRGAVVLKMYDVADLVVPEPTTLAANGFEIPHNIPATIEDMDATGLTRMDAGQLIALIKSRVDPSGWTEDGSAIAMKMSRTLFVCQTEDALDSIQQLLDDLRMQCVPPRTSEHEPPTFQIDEPSSSIKQPAP